MNMNDDLYYYLKDIHDHHTLRIESFIKFIIEGGTLEDEDLKKFGLSPGDIDYVNEIYTVISLTLSYKR